MNENKMVDRGSERKKNVLVIYFSQSGQLKEIVDSILGPLETDPEVSVFTETLRPVKPFPFPWTAMEFCDVFPESFEEIPCELEPFRFPADKKFDLVILALQVWYLSPSRPISAFLQSAEGKRAMKGTPVLTVIGCRNMWIEANQKVQKRIRMAGGIPAGKIVLTDRTPNLIGVVTITVWMLTGKKKALFGMFPSPGISGKDIADAERFGPVILDAVRRKNGIPDPEELHRMKAATIVPSFLLFEKRISRIFGVWSAFIRRKGDFGDPGREPRVRCFLVYLLFAIFAISPIAAFVSVFRDLIRPGRKTNLEQ